MVCVRTGRQHCVAVMSANGLEVRLMLRCALAEVSIPRCQTSIGLCRVRLAVQEIIRSGYSILCTVLRHGT